MAATLVSARWSWLRPGLRHWRPAVAVIAAFVALRVFQTCVPLNMDEFVSYQTLACLSHPHSRENVFCQPCAGFYLRVAGGFSLPLLTYDYIGSFSSLLYAPLFALWPSPVSARLTGVIALFVQALVLARMFRLRTSVVFCALLAFLPYSFPHIADTGPVAFQTTSVLVVCYLLRRWLLCRHWRRRALMMAAAGLLIALGCWVKPTYFFVSFGLAITALGGFLLALRRRNPCWAVRTAEYALLFSCAAIPALLVYESHHPNGSPYLPVVTANYLPGQVVLDGLGQRFQENVLHFLTHPLDATAPCFNVRPDLPAWNVVICLLGGVIILGGILRPRISLRWRNEILVDCSLFVLALLLVATNVYAKSMHHVVLAYPFLLLAACRSVQGRQRAPVFRAALVLFLLLNGSLFCWFPSMLAEARRDADRKVYVARLNDDLNREDATGSVLACVDWGLYFVKALYGPRSEVVLFVCSLDDPQTLRQAAAIARRLHRNLTVVGLRDNRRARELLRTVFPEVEERAEPDANNPWRIWRIPAGKLGPPDPASPVPDFPSALRPPSPEAGLHGGPPARPTASSPESAT